MSAKVLIVEDDKEMLGFGSRKLKRAGYTVLMAETLEQAGAVLKKNEVDMIVLDVMLPDGSGFDFCRKLRQSSDVPVLFLTGKTQIADKIEGLEGGGDYYMTKPYDFDEFIAVVGSLVRRSKKAPTPEVIKQKKLGPLLIDFENSGVSVDGEDLPLTPKEFALLVILVEHVNEPLSSEYLYERAWKTPMMSSDGGALWAQLSRLRKKLERFRVFELVNDRTRGYYLEYIE